LALLLCQSSNLGFVAAPPPGEGVDVSTAPHPTNEPEMPMCQLVHRRLTSGWKMNASGKEKLAGCQNNCMAKCDTCAPRPDSPMSRAERYEAMLKCQNTNIECADQCQRDLGTKPENLDSTTPPLDPTLEANKQMCLITDRQLRGNLKMNASGKEKLAICQSDCNGVCNNCVTTGLPSGKIKLTARLKQCADAKDKCADDCQKNLGSDPRNLN